MPSLEKVTIPEEVYNSFDYWDLKERTRKAWQEAEYKRIEAGITNNEPVLSTEALREIHDFTFNCKLNKKAKVEDSIKSLVPMANVTEPLAHVDHARLQWENSVAEEVYALATEAKLPLVSKLTSPLTPERLKADLEDCRFLYDREDLLHTLQQIEAQNRQTTGITAPSAATSWGIIPTLFSSHSMDQLRQIYKDLIKKADNEIIDVDYLLHFGTKTQLLLYCRKGLANHLRPSIWQKVLDTSNRKRRREEYQALQLKIHESHYITDPLYRLDVSHTVNDPTYFPFEETLLEIMMVFSRDDWVRTSSDVAYLIHSEVLTASNAAVPPSGVQPFHGLVMYLAPLCYLYEDHAQIYYVFREMYAKYWCRLNVIRSADGTLLRLCTTFETLVQQHIPETLMILHDTYDIPMPLSLVFEWIHCGFSGILEVDQVLVLWDCVVGFDSLEILPIFAAALFIYRSPAMLKTAKSLHNTSSSTIEAIKAILSENSEIRVLPILQTFLFA